MLSRVVGAGVNVVLTAHAMMRKFEQPDAAGAYDRWELKLSKQVAPLVKEWPDMLLFANYKTIVSDVQKMTGKGKVQDGTTVKVLNTEDDWVKITDYSTGKTGWIMEKYIEVDDVWPNFGDGFFDDEDDDIFESEVGSVYHVTGTNSLNVRSGPGSSNKKLDSLFEGTAFRVTDTSGNWFEIKTFDGVTGWVSKNYTTAGADAVVTASTLNMRSGAGTGYSVKRSLSYGAVVKVNSVDGNWAHVTYKGVSGYVSLNYLSF
jgi:SH3-like domain-containing protein